MRGLSAWYRATSASDWARASPGAERKRPITSTSAFRRFAATTDWGISVLIALWVRSQDNVLREATTYKPMTRTSATVTANRLGDLGWRSRVVTNKAAMPRLKK